MLCSRLFRKLIGWWIHLLTALVSFWLATMQGPPGRRCSLVVPGFGGALDVVAAASE